MFTPTLADLAKCVRGGADDLAKRPREFEVGNREEHGAAWTNEERENMERRQRPRLQRGRDPAEGAGWREIFLAHEKAGEASSVAEAVADGHSVLLRDDLVGEDECQDLLREGTALTARGVASTIRIKVSDHFSAKGQAICNNVLLRALTFIQSEISVSLGDSLREAHGGLGQTRLMFSAGEPGVNIYRAGGSFRRHEDGQELTVLVNLSPCSAYEGGGTAFWALPGRAKDMAAPPCTTKPTFVLAPPPGTAIFFGGQVTHAGQETKHGVRGLFVASMSAKMPTGNQP